MAKKLGISTGRFNANAAAIATAINSTPATSAAEVRAMGELLDVLRQRPSIFLPLLKLCSPQTQDQLQPE